MSALYAGFVEALIFTSIMPDTNGEPIDWYGFTAGDIDEESEARILCLVEEFAAEYEDTIEAWCEATGEDEVRAGNMLLYALGGHGRGFWEWDDEYSRTLDAWCKVNLRDTGELCAIPYTDRDGSDRLDVRVR